MIAFREVLKLATGCSIVAILSGCHLVERLASVNEAPELSQIQNPKEAANYQPVSIPMPDARGRHKEANSLWQIGSKAFFKDQRANKVGDVITVVVSIDNTQTMDMSPEINRTSQSSLNYKKFFLFTNDYLPGEVDLSSNPSLKGKGKYNVSDKVAFTIASVVTQVLPNGSLIVQGRREVRLMNEVREMSIIGVVRREDVLANNTIESDKIAELRVSYGGRGDLSDTMRAPWGQQILNQVAPF